MRLYHNTSCKYGCVTRKVLHFRNKEEHIKEVRDACTDFCRNRYKRHITTKTLEVNLVFSEVLLCAFDVSVGFVYLVDGDDIGNTCLLNRLEGLFCLLLYAVFCRNNKDGNIRN